MRRSVRGHAREDALIIPRIKHSFLAVTRRVRSRTLPIEIRICTWEGGNPVPPQNIESLENSRDAYHGGCGDPPSRFLFAFNSTTRRRHIDRAPNNP
ncbi:MAG: hypothetical protein RL326_1731 [Pseudomonadota bacterium]